jgi:L-iditol 2-dehydrogenase
MNKVVINGMRQADIVEVPRPGSKEDWALVKIHVAPMCTEYKAYRDGEHNAFLGHEAAGEVVEVAQRCEVEVGDQVVVMPQYPCGKCSLCLEGEYIHCQNVIDMKAFTGSREGTATYAQYLLKPSWLLPKIPDAISYEHASMLCCGLGPTFGAIERMGVDESDTILITGMGDHRDGSGWAGGSH